MVAKSELQDRLWPDVEVLEANLGNAAAEIRKARAELKDQLKSGKTTLAAVLDRAEGDDVVGKLKVSAVLQALPGIGKIRATQIMEKLKIADSRRLRGLGEQQRKALLGEFAAN